MGTHFVVTVEERWRVSVPERFHLGIERCCGRIALALGAIRRIADERSKRIHRRLCNLGPVVRHMELFMGQGNGRRPISSPRRTVRRARRRRRQIGNNRRAMPRIYMRVICAGYVGATEADDPNAMFFFELFQTETPLIVVSTTLVFGAVGLWVDLAKSAWIRRLSNLLNVQVRHDRGTGHSDGDVLGLCATAAGCRYDGITLSVVERRI